MSISKLGVGHARYYVDQAGDRVDAVESIGDGVEEYYAGPSRESRGEWFGAGARELGLRGEVSGEQLRHVEAALRDGRTYLMGDQFTSADILLTTCLDWAIAYGVGICDNAQPYRERIHQRPGYQRGNEANRPLKPITPAKAPAKG